MLNVQDKPASFGDSIKIWGEFRIRNGTYDSGWKPNKLVGDGLRHIVNVLGGPGSNGNNICEGFGSSRDGRVGTGTGATVDTTTDLVTPIATAPNTVSAITRESPAAGQYRLKYTMTWNAGTLSAVTITEIAIKSRLYNNLATAAISAPGVGTGLFSRLSSTDGEFSSFLINTAVPLTIEWRLNFNF